MGTNTSAGEQTTQDKLEGRRNLYEEKLEPMKYCWSHGHKVIYSHTIKKRTNRKEGQQEKSVKTNMMGVSVAHVGWKPSE